MATGLASTDASFARNLFDLILVSDNEALEYVLTHRAELFSEAPVVFCGIENIAEVPLDGQPDITGVEIKRTIGRENTFCDF